MESVMSRKAYIFSVAAVFVMVYIFDFLVEHYILIDYFNMTKELWLPDSDKPMLAMSSSQLFFSMIFVFIFSRNYEDKGVSEGMRYGSYIGLLLAAMYLRTYFWVAIPFMLTFGWMLASFIKCVLAGAVTSVVFRETHN